MKNEKTNYESGGVVLWIIILIIIGTVIYYFFFRDSSDEVVVEPTVEEDVKFLRGLSLTLENLSDSQPLSQGVILIHDSSVDFDFKGEIAPPEFELLAEVGEPGPFLLSIDRDPTVFYAIPVDSPIEPGQSKVVELPPEIPYLTGETEPQLSVLQMAVASNDGYVFATTSLLPGNINRSFIAENHDAGTEENTEIGSGFAGGQPDPSRSLEENLDNGVATEPRAVVIVHPQLTDDLLRVTLNGPTQ
ncbi:MAG: spondin domain-containing protein [Candidatus Campbellbacteria bacterium]|nr:spondin domain-containing protein [Candidatus Campbellbacteria bacterium]